MSKDDIICELETDIICEPLKVLGVPQSKVIAYGIGK